MKIRRTLAVLALVSTTLSMPASANISLIVDVVDVVGVGFRTGMSHLSNASYSVANVNAMSHLMQNNPLGYAMCGARTFTNWLASHMNGASQITCLQISRSFGAGYALAPVAVGIGCGIAAYLTYKVASLTCKGIASSYRYLANR